MTQPLGGLILLFFLAITPTSHATAVFSFNGPYQFAKDQGYQPTLLANDKYERNDYEGIGARIDIYTDPFAPPETGDAWYVSLDQRESGQRLGQIVIHYDAARDCYVMGASPVACGIRENSDELGEIHGALISVFFFGQCIDTEDYDMVLEYQLAGDPLTTSYKSPFIFRPTRFRPILDEHQVFLPANLRPGFNQHDTVGEKGEVRVVLMDDLGCSEVVEDAEVTVTATVIPGSNGQQYLQPGERGTGEFLSLGYESEVDNSDQFQGTKIKGRTNESGVFAAEYQALKHGAKERLRFQAKLLAVDGEPEYEAPDLEKELKISHPGLVRLDSSALPIYFVYGSGCPDHHPQPQWMTPYSRVSFGIVAQLYHRFTGRYLSVNDASLEFGGVIANADGGGRDADCHDLHRTGRDVDLNSIDRSESGSAGVNMRTATVTYDGMTLTIVDLLARWVHELNGRQEDEVPIHFKWPY